MPSIQEIRQSYPQYSDISDEQLLSGLHRRFYSDMPFQDFMGRITMGEPAQAEPTGPQSLPVPERGFFGTVGARAGDVAGSLVSGAGGIASGVGGLAGMATGGFDNPLSRAGRGIREYGETLMSPELQNKRAAFAQALSQAESQGFAAEAATAARELVSNPGLLASMAIEQIPQFLASFGIGRGALAVGQRVGGTAEAGRRAGVGAAIGSSAGLQGGDIAGQTYEDVMKLPVETMQQSPAYRELLATMSPQEARESLATRAGREAGLMAGGLSAATTALLPGVERAAFSQNLSRNAISRALRVGTGEAVGEGIEEGGGQFAQNLAASRADTERDLMRGVGGAATTGAILGGAMGAGVGAISAPPVDPEEARRAELRGATENVVEAVEPEPEAPAPQPDRSPERIAQLIEISKGRLETLNNNLKDAYIRLAEARSRQEVDPDEVSEIKTEISQINMQAKAQREDISNLNKLTASPRAGQTTEAGPRAAPFQPGLPVVAPQTGTGPTPTPVVIPVQQQTPAPAPVPPPEASPVAEEQPPAPVVPETPPAPAPVAVQEEDVVPPPKFVSFNAPVGARFPVFTPPGQGGQSISTDVVTEMVDLFSLVPASGRLQNRNIDAKANQRLIAKISNNPDFNQLATSPYADRGAPVVGPDNIVEVGNHRIAGLKKAAEENPEGFSAYIKSLQNAGYDTQGMKFPVLIRRRVGEMDENQRVRFVKAANKNPAQNLGPVELAREDADFLTPELLAKFDGTMDAGIDAAKNRPFVNDFIAAISSGNDMSDFVDPKTGSLIPDGRNRINRALFASAYRDQSLLDKAINSPKDNLVSITNALISVVPSMQALRLGIENGRIRDEFDIIFDIVRSADLIQVGKDKDMTPAQILQMEDLVTPISPETAAVIRLLSNQDMDGLASKAAMIRRFKAYVEEASTQTPDIDLMGGEYRITPVEAIDIAIEKAKTPTEKAKQTAMFSARPVVAEDDSQDRRKDEEFASDKAAGESWPEYYSKRLSGPVIYDDGNVALIESMSAKGNPVYVGVNESGGYTFGDIENYTGATFFPDEINKLIKAKRDHLAKVDDIIKKNPNGPFKPGQIASFDDSFPNDMRGFSEGLMKELGINNAQVLFVDYAASDNPEIGPSNKMYGRYFYMRRMLASQKPKYGDDIFGLSSSSITPTTALRTITINFDKLENQGLQFETIAHEIGHVFDRVVFRNAPKDQQKVVFDAFESWLKKNGNLPANEYMQVLRTALIGQKLVSPSLDNVNIQQLKPYWREFEEWFADQVAKWSLTSKPAETLLGRFFQQVAAGYRIIIRALGAKGLPDQSVADFIENHRKSIPELNVTSIVPETTTRGTPPAPRGKQVSFDFTTARKREAKEGEVLPEGFGQTPGATGRQTGFEFSSKREDTESASGKVRGSSVQKPTAPPGTAKSFYQTVIKDVDNSSVLDRILSKILDKKGGESIGSAIARTSINQAAPLYNLDKMARAEGYTGLDASKALEMSMSNSGRIAQMLSIGMGKIDPKTGVISLRNDVKPLLQIMKDAGIANNEGMKEQLQAYLAALRERDLRAAGRKGFINQTTQAVNATIKEAEAKHPQWKKTAAELDKLNEALIDWAMATGLVTRKQARVLKDKFYTPFYREDYEYVTNALGRELKGGEKALNDLFGNIILNADSIMKAGLKNLATKTAIETMEFVKLAKPNTSDKKNDNTITVRINGKPTNYDVEDAVLFSALSAMPRQMIGGIYQTMANMASFFRDMVTVAPSFIIANLYRGKISAFVQEGQPLTTNTFAGMRDALNASTSLQNFQLQTGFGGLEYGMGARNMAEVFERKLNDQGIIKSLSKRKVIQSMKEAFSKMQELSEASEMAERIKLAENLIKKGMKPEDAYFQGYMLAPYTRKGTGQGWLGASIQFMMPLVPFLNAKIQTTYRLVENEKGDKRRLWTAGIPQQIFLRGLVVTAFSLMAYGLNLADDEDEWDKIPNYMKLEYDMVPFMGNYISLPRAFEIGKIFGAIPVFILDAIRRGEGRDLTEALIEVGKSTFWMNPIPKAVDPILAAVTNYDFFRGRPLETKGDEALPVQERINRSTTQTGEALSAVVNTVFGNVLSPIKAQALLDGYTGTLGVTIMAGFDSLLAASGAIPGKPAGAFGDPATMPAILANAAGLNRFYREGDMMVSRFVGDFYKIKEMTDQLVRSESLAREANDFQRLQELRGEEGLPLRMRQVVSAAGTQISEINKRIRMIERQDTDGVTKAQAIQPLIDRRDRIAKRVVDQARSIGAF